MLISPLNLKILACTLDLEGLDSGAAWRACGLAAADLDDEAWVPLAPFDRMMAEALRQSGDACFGLKAGRSVALTRYGVVAPLAMNAPDLRTLLNDLLRFAVLLLPEPECRVQTHDGVVTIDVHPLGLQEATRAFRREVVMVGLMQVLRFSGVTPAEVLEVSLAHEAPPNTAAHTDALGRHLRFGQPHSRIRFDAAALDRPIGWHDPQAYLSALGRAEAALAAMAARHDVSARARQILLSTLPCALSAREMAEALGMSERSLRRHLAQAGTRHADLLQECRILLATRLLARGGCPIKQVAHQSGFQSVSGFHRAFRRWTQRTPSDWRAQAITSGS